MLAQVLCLSLTPHSNDFASTLLVPPGQWSHLVFRYNITNSTMSIALNGVLQSQGSHAPFLGATTLLLGRSLTGYYGGLLDEVQFFASALSNQDILALYAQFQSTIGSMSASTCRCLSVWLLIFAGNGPNGLDCFNGGMRLYNNQTYNVSFTCGCVNGTYVHVGHTMQR